jgi:hypothetical protein
VSDWEENLKERGMGIFQKMQEMLFQTEISRGFLLGHLPLFDTCSLVNFIAKMH